MSAPHVRLARPADPADRERVVETVVAAFAGDPAFQHFFPQDEYAEQAPIFARHLFDQRAPAGGVWLVDNGAAVALWNPPGVVPTWPPAALASSAVHRMERYDEAVHRLLPTEPHWYLGVLATHPDQAGRRLGRLVMGAGLARASADGLPAYLEAVTPTNVAIYERSGWQVTGTTTVDELHVRVMRHEPGASVG